MGREIMGTEGRDRRQADWEVTPGPEARGDNVLWWEHGRLRQSIPLLECRAMAYTSKPRFDADLVEAARQFYGLEMDVASVELEILEDDDQRLRFLPWFIWDWRGGRDPRTVGEQFLAEGGFESYEVRVVESLCASCVGLYQAHEAATNRGVLVTDLVTGEEIEVSDERVVGEVSAGDVIQARLVRVPTLDGECVLLGAVYAVMPPESAAAVLRELETLGPTPDSIREEMERRTSEMLDFVDRLMTSMALPPMLAGPEGELMVVHRGRLDPTAGRTVLALARRQVERFTPVGPGIWAWQPEGRVEGFVVSPEKGRVELVAVSAARYQALEQAVCEHSDASPPRMRCLTDLERIVERWVAGREDHLWLQLMPEVADAVRKWLGTWTRRWMDRPHIELGDRSPRQAVLEPQGRQRVEWLVERLEQIHMTHLPQLDSGDITGLRSELRLPRPLA